MGSSGGEKELEVALIERGRRRAGWRWVRCSIGGRGSSGGVGVVCSGQAGERSFWLILDWVEEVMKKDFSEISGDLGFG